MEARDSAVGRLLRSAGVDSVRGAKITLREAERLTGVSRQTLANWLAPVDPARPIRHKYSNLDAVADALGIDRLELGHASMIDNGMTEISSSLDSEGDPVLIRLGQLQRQAQDLADRVAELSALYRGTRER